MAVLSARAYRPSPEEGRLVFPVAAETLGSGLRKGVEWYSAVHLVVDVMTAEGVRFFWQRCESW